jgi:topoisomerase IV subunit A
LSDARAFNLKEGLSWTDSSGRNFVVTDLKEWIGERAQAGRAPPSGFPKRNKFG